MSDKNKDNTIPLDDSSDDSPVGGPLKGLTRMGHYELLKELGRGAQGVVYLAEDIQLHRKVALKVLAGAAAQSESVRERFQREAEITSKLDHPGICAVYEMGEEEGIPYIAMQYVRGTTLADLVEDSITKLDSESKTASKSIHIQSTALAASEHGDMQDVVSLIERAARALHSAHEAGLVHRDIKPGNIMVTPEGDPVLLDFGLARDVESEGHTLTQSGQIMGTPAYLAPEQIRAVRDAIDRRTDVYALGVTLFECLTLTRPFDAETFEQLFQSILTDLPPNPRKLNPRVPQDLRTVIETAMERDCKRRYQTAQAFAEDLRRVRTFEPILARAAGPVVRATKWGRRHPAKASAIVAVTLFALTGAGFVIGQSLQRAAAVREHLDQAERRLDAGDFSGPSRPWPKRARTTRTLLAPWSCALASNASRSSRSAKRNGKRTWPRLPPPARNPRRS